MASVIVIFVSVYAFKIHRKLQSQIVPFRSMKLQKQNVSTIESSFSSNNSDAAQRIQEGWC